MGGEGIRVTKPEEVGPALTSLIASGKPGVLEIVVSQVYNARFYLQRIKIIRISSMQVNHISIFVGIG